MITAIALAMLSCGSERWDVKTLTDDAADKVNLDAAPASIDDLQTLKQAPKKWDPHAERAGIEQATVKVDAVLIGAKLEDDEDLHIVIADAQDTKKTMIVEIPSAHCLEKTNPLLRQSILAARAKFLTLMRVSAKFKKFATPKPATITGVIFFDKLHGQTGVAPNGVELHPVLGLELRQLHTLIDCDMTKTKRLPNGAYQFECKQ